ncbi:MAG: exosortase/archaeosortase family protein [Candidatus Diapherotrites archaeon]|jgi:exosortase/archaeosortase family protein|uniref:Exosortase/archaeosortase family protein n=1 Tax=Candidatus Iainarchaeum sp. TaxID=3101447 RepID=A0A8T5GEC1_9ARCH|nr:exosortase/archaeosortase family protein [Candidatus Diapherotrites archaeon]MBT7241244.1 exosortase/archaeosortase family protein [Candidatus Diapherotrites archaeon]
MVKKKSTPKKGKPILFCKENEKCMFCETTNKIKNYFVEQEKKIVKDQKKQFVWFVLGFLIFYLILSGITIPFSTSIQESTGRSAQGLLSAQGIETVSNGNVELENFETAYSFEINQTSQTIFISWLCSGALEIIILVSAILASFGIGWRKKVIGAIVAVILGYVFNLLRIFVTLNIIMSQNEAVFEIAHDTLFRLVLFVYIIVVYVLWFIWARK